ncbi:MAG: hypothetical protein COV91_06160 [Candidatus Taylorbacteria bacterium CG11_big_fil_rev_8_21_14_0_20_46_11]|uniref:Uncharacterized protein n=1 Tax=Candidatus Taylorbacteria bacterium CG11_big_fil_rev_8_21_14_0_20_46_11 TaxID=1975025 RepID=A0A2H0K9X8_9BACT|nr:MAG: hypothetical protein COV91_06160 [Candidatus Taylorbacteria bacterium CG11_big_fil_rev_8_21_14_0_20_46_11]
MKNVILTIIAFTFVFTVYFFVLRNLLPEWAESGQFGDMFGGLNAFFSGLAFLGVIYAIFLQREELGLQRKELELTREELKRTAEAQEKSEKALSKQAASLKVTAKLNGLSAILQHFNTLIELTNSEKYGINEIKFNLLKHDADEIIEKVKNLIEDK